MKKYPDYHSATDPPIKCASHRSSDDLENKILENLNSGRKGWLQAPAPAQVLGKVGCFMIQSESFIFCGMSVESCNIVSISQ